MSVKTYDPKSLIISFAGQALTGFADGVFCNIVPSGDKFTAITGADGEVSRSKSVDYSYEVTITLQQTSESNDKLSTIMIADKLRNAGVFPLSVKDLEGTSFFFASSAWIQKDPDVSYGKEIENREWVFRTGPADNYVGGNQVFTT